MSTSNSDFTLPISNVVLKSALKYPDALNVVHINIRSLLPKIDQLRAVIFKTNVHVIIISESWLNSDLPSDCVKIPGFKLYRNDRDKVDVNGGWVRGGGVAIYVRCGMAIRILNKSTPNDEIEYLFAELKTKKGPVLLGGVYFPHPSMARLIPLKQTLNNLCFKYENIIIAGDFNIDLLETSEGIKSRFISMLDNLSLSVVNDCIPTRFNTNRSSLLDYFLTVTNRVGDVLSIGQTSVSGISDHDLIYLAYKIPISVSKDKVTYRDYKNCDVNMLLNHARELQWFNIYLSNDINDKVQFFNSLVLKLFDFHIPLKTFKPRVNFIPYYSQTISDLSSQRDLAFEEWKSNKTAENKEKFKTLRNKVTLLIRQAKKRYLASNLDPNLPSATFWNNSSKLGLSKPKNREEVGIFDANELNRNFLVSGSLASQVRLGNNHLWQRSGTEETIISTNDNFSFHNIDFNDVSRAFLHIKSNATGLDLIPLKFLKLLLPVILPYLVHIFNTILTTSEFPMIWKRAKVIPVPKKTNPGINDLRPISILPGLSKVFEFLVHEQILQYLDDAELLFPFQSGFRKKHSTKTALLEITDVISENIDKKHATLLLLLDFSKAFDSVNHNLLCEKLDRNFKFHRSAVKLIKNYLNHRLQSVIIGNITSDYLETLCGVPQGSILGPLLFSIFINDLPQCLSVANCRLYADDAQIFLNCHFSKLPSCVAKMNDELDAISFWAMTNYLKLNAAKSQALVIYSKSIPTLNLPQLKINENAIPYVDHAKNLGVVFNTKLSWSDHIKYIANRVYPLLRRLWKLAYLVPFQTKCRLIKALILPHFFYCDVVYSSMSVGESADLNVIFNACTRFVTNRRRFDSISDVSKLILNCTFNNYLQFKYLCFLHNLISFASPQYLYNKICFGRSTRSIMINIPRHNSRIRHLSFFVRIASLWNSLPNDVKNAQTQNIFSKLCFEYLKDK